VIVHRDYSGSGYSEMFKKFGAQDEVPDVEEDVHPVAAAWEAAPVNAAIKAANGIAIDLAFFAAPPADDLDEDSSTLDPPLKIVAVEPSLVSAVSDWKADFLKRVGLSEPSGNTLKKKLGIASTTIRRDADGVDWIRAFDGDGVLIDIRTLLPVKDE
jgi:hypothetical protein